MLGKDGLEPAVRHTGIQPECFNVVPVLIPLLADGIFASRAIEVLSTKILAVDAAVMGVVAQRLGEPVAEARQVVQERGRRRRLVGDGIDRHRPLMLLGRVDAAQTLLPRAFVDDDARRLLAQCALLVEQGVGRHDPHLHVVAVAQLALIAAAVEERAALLLAPTTRGGDIGVALLREPHRRQVQAHRLPRMKRIVSPTAAKDARVDAVRNELLLNGLIQVMPRRGVDGWLARPVLEPGRQFSIAIWVLPTPVSTRAACAIGGSGMLPRYFTAG